MDRRRFLLCAALVAPALARAEDLIPYRRLTWSDFRRVPDSAGPMDAATEGRIRYSYQWEWSSRGDTVTARVRSVTVQSYFDRGASWRKERLSGDPALLLQHEQGHLDITHSAALALMRLSPADFGTETGSSPDAARDRLVAKVKQVFENALTENRKRQAQYDRETNHGRDPKAQAQWTAQLRTEIASGDTPGAPTQPGE